MSMMLSPWFTFLPSNVGVNRRADETLRAQARVPRQLREALHPAVARSSRYVNQPQHIVTNPIMSHKAERRPRSREVWVAVT